MKYSNTLLGMMYLLVKQAHRSLRRISDLLRASRACELEFVFSFTNESTSCRYPRPQAHYLLHIQAHYRLHIRSYTHTISSFFQFRVIFSWSLISHHTVHWDSPIEQKFCIPLVWLFTSATEPAGRMVFLDCPLRWRVFPVLDCWVAMVLLKDFIGTSSVYISTPK